MLVPHRNEEIKMCVCCSLPSRSEAPLQLTGPLPQLFRVPGASFSAAPPQPGSPHNSLHILLFQFSSAEPGKN